MWPRLQRRAGRDSETVPRLHRGRTRHQLLGQGLGDDEVALGSAGHEPSPDAAVLGDKLGLGEGPDGAGLDGVGDGVGEGDFDGRGDGDVAPDPDGDGRGAADREGDGLGDGFVFPGALMAGSTRVAP
jgi:hypothetical protein